MPKHVRTALRQEILFPFLALAVVDPSEQVEQPSYSVSESAFNAYGVAVNRMLAAEMKILEECESALIAQAATKPDKGDRQAANARIRAMQLLQRLKYLRERTY